MKFFILGTKIYITLEFFMIKLELKFHMIIRIVMNLLNNYFRFYNDKKRTVAVINNVHCAFLINNIIFYLIILGLDKT